MKYFSELVDICNNYNIPRESVCIVGSSVLADIIGRENNDIDTILLPAERNKLILKYGKTLNVLKSGTINFGVVQFSYNRYQAIGLKDEEIFTDSFMDFHDGFRIIKVELEIAKKIKRNEEKDRLDVMLFCNSDYNKSVDWGLVYKLFSYKAPVSTNIFSKARRSLAHCLFKLGGVKLSFPEVLAIPYVRSRLSENAKKIVSIYCLYLMGIFDESNNSFTEYIRDFDFQLAKKRKKLYEDNNYHAVIGIDQFGNIENPYDLACEIVKGNQFCYFNVDKKRKNNNISINESVLAYLKKDIDKLLSQNGCYFVGIIWGAASKYFNEIVCDLSYHCKIIHSFKLDLTYNYDAFIDAVYANDDLEPWKIAIKKSFLCKYKEAVIVIMDIPNPCFKVNVRTGLPTSQTAINIKKYVRKKYRQYIEDYADDIIFHICDNYDSNRRLYSVVQNEKEKRETKRLVRKC